MRYIKLIFDKLLQNLFIPTNSSPREIVCDNLKRNSGEMRKIIFLNRYIGQHKTKYLGSGTVGQRSQSGDPALAKFGKYQMWTLTRSSRAKLQIFLLISCLLASRQLELSKDG